MAKLVTEVDGGRHMPVAKRKFGDLLDQWLEVKATGERVRVRHAADVLVRA